MKTSLETEVKLHYFKLYYAYSISFNSSNVDSKFFWRWILKDCIEVREKTKKAVVLCSCPTKNVKLGTFTSYSFSDNEEMHKTRDARAKLYFFWCKPTVFCRSRSRLICRRCLSSQIVDSEVTCSCHVIELRLLDGKLTNKKLIITKTVNKTVIICMLSTQVCPTWDTNSTSYVLLDTS